MFLTLKYTDLTKNTYIQSWTVHIYIYIYIYINSSTIIKNKNYKLQKAKIYIINNSKSNNVEGFYPTPRTRNIIKPCHFIVIRLHLHRVWQCPLEPKYIVCCQQSTVLQQMCIWHSEEHASWYILIITAYKMHYFSNLFWYRTLHTWCRFTVCLNTVNTVLRLLMMDSKSVRNM